MNEFREEFLIKLSIPIYTIVIGIEILYSYLKHKHYYSTKGLLSNLYLTSLNFSLDRFNWCRISVLLTVWGGNSTDASNPKGSGDLIPKVCAATRYKPSNP